MSADPEGMGEHVDRLIALSGTEHVKAYTKKDGTRVEAHTRVGGSFKADLGGGNYATRTSKTKNYTHAIVVKDKTTGEEGVYGWSQSPTNAMKMQQRAAYYGYSTSRVVPATREEGSATYKPKAPKAQDKPAESVVEPPKKSTGSQGPKEGAKPTKRGVNYFPERHPAPEFKEGDETPEGQITVARLDKYDDGSYHWVYYLKGKGRQEYYGSQLGG